MFEATLPHKLALAAESPVAVTFTDRQERDAHHSWSDVWEKSRSIAAGLRSRGIRRGDRVCLILPTGMDFLAGFFGCQLIRAVPVPLYPPIRLGKLEEYYERTAACLRKVEARLVVTESTIARLLGQVEQRYRPELGVVLAADVYEHGASIAVAARTDDLALIQYSSGTTGDPKPVGLTHAQVLANVRSLMDYVQREPDDRVVTWLPLYHDMGLVTGVVTTVNERAPVTFIKPEDFLARPSLWLRTMSRHRGTIASAPSFAYDLCALRIKDEELDGVDLSSWRLAFNGAEPISPKALWRFCSRFAFHGFRGEAMKPVYGLAEATLGVTFSPRERGFQARTFDATRLAFSGEALPGEGRELVSVGTPLRDMRVEVRSEDGSEQPPGRVGRIWVSGPSVIRSYFELSDSAERSARDEAEHWLDTGDEGFVWEGELYITGRSKDMIVVNGRNHAPQDIERCLDEVDGVRLGCTAACGTPSPDGEQLVIFVEAQAPTEALGVACRRAVLASHGIVARYVVMLAPGTLPRTSSGKIRRGETLRLWLRDELVPPKPVNAAMLSLHMVKNAWARLGL